MTVRATHKQTLRDGKLVDETLTLTGNLGLWDIARKEVENRFGEAAAASIRWVGAESKFLQIKSDNNEVIYEWQGDRVTIKMNQGDKEEPGDAATNA